MTEDKEIEAALLANITNEWRKLAFVVGKAMIQLTTSERDDLYFAGRVIQLVERGLVEYDGDLEQMRNCEVRLSRR